MGNEVSKRDLVLRDKPSDDNEESVKNLLSAIVRKVSGGILLKIGLAYCRCWWLRFSSITR